jgi:hypothetical protein
MNVRVEEPGEHVRRLREFDAFAKVSEAMTSTAYLTRCLHCVKPWTRLWRATYRKRQRPIRVDPNGSRAHVAGESRGEALVCYAANDLGSQNFCLRRHGDMTDIADGQ